MTYKQTFFICIALFISSGLCAQNVSNNTPAKSYGYLRIGLGHNIPVAGQRTGYINIPYNGTIVNGNNGPLSFNVKSASFSAGTNGNIALGAIFKKNIGFEVNTSFVFSGTKYAGYLENNRISYSSKERYSYRKINNLFVNPAIVFETGRDFRVYVRTGIILPVISRIEADFYYDEVNNGRQTIIYGSEKIKHSFNIGISGAIGFKAKLVDGVMFSFETNYNSLTLDIKSVELTSLFYNNQNVFGYVTNTTQQYSSNSKKASSSNPTVTHPYSSAGLNMGLEFSF